MKNFSNEIVTPEMLNESITTAFEKQNEYFAQQVEKRLNPIKYMMIGMLIVNIITLVLVSL